MILKTGCIKMKQKNLYLLVGAPGSGKSTWVKNRIAQDGGVWCSRDEVRFSLVKENEEYFSKENDVFAAWIKNINSAIKDVNTKNIYADATHISQKSRNKTLLHLDLKNVNIIPVVMTTNSDECVRRNKMRTGRECVPVAVIYRMSSRLMNEPVDKDLCWNYKEIIYV